MEAESGNTKRISRKGTEEAVSDIRSVELNRLDSMGHRAVVSIILPREGMNGNRHNIAGASMRRLQCRMGGQTEPLVQQRNS